MKIFVGYLLIKNNKVMYAFPACEEGLKQARKVKENLKHMYKHDDTYIIFRSSVDKVTVQD